MQLVPEKRQHEEAAAGGALTPSSCSSKATAASDLRSVQGIGAQAKGERSP